MTVKIITFDLGGTLMDYAGMPASWTDYYKQGFEAINSYYNYKVSEDYIKQSVEILKSFNPRLHYRIEKKSFHQTTYFRKH